MILERTRRANSGVMDGRGPVLYWMHRDHRVRDNWALIQAGRIARELRRPLVAAHCLDPAYPLATPEHFAFLLAGLVQVERDLAARNIPFLRLLGDPGQAVARLARDLDAAAVVADFDPLRHKRRWLAAVAGSVPCAVLETDARNVAPCFLASDKREYMARTIRPKIHRLLPQFLEEFPEAPRQDAAPALALDESLRAPWPERLARAFPALAGATPPRGFSPGEAAAQAALERFVRHVLRGYATRRNDPAQDGQSGLSPWLHFGMLSAQRAALAALEARAPREDTDAFLEELIVRRELADNFCLHAPAYDRVECFPEWALRSLDKHRADPRPALYAREELEQGRTGDPAWNAAQLEMVRTGKMHGYMRMYWAKMFLNWTPDVRQALALAVEFNDRYSLDGRDPNGYAGIAWSLGGVHDRPWVERPVFGQVRCMTLGGLRRKFSVEAYVARVAAVTGGFPGVRDRR